MEDLRALIPLDDLWADIELTEKLLLEAVVSEDDYLTTIAPVSYTHLTLPTIYSV